MVSKRLSKEEFVEIFSKVPRLCVDVFVRNEKGILLTKRTIEPGKGDWHLPGGSVFINETLKQATERIAKEELRLNVRVIGILGTTDFFNEGNYPKHSVSVVFLVEPVSKDIQLDNNAGEFIFTKEIPKNILYCHKKFLEKYFKCEKSITKNF